VTFRFPDSDAQRPVEVHVNAAALYASMLKNGYIDEATEFVEWYLDTFDHDLED
jgi:hypothetical protein